MPRSRQGPVFRSSTIQPQFFDRIVHLSCGLLPVAPIPELVRSAGIRGFWVLPLPLSAVLAQSGLFEVAEGLIAEVVSPELGTAYLGT